jgi:hypothetical protein
MPPPSPSRGAPQTRPEGPLRTAGASSGPGDLVLGRADVNNWVQTVGVICAVYRELKGTYDRGDTALRRSAVAHGPDKGTQGPKKAARAAAFREKLEDDF